MLLHAHYGSGGEGHIYQGRFKSFPIQDDEHFFTVCRSVERNALRASLVNRAEDWKWGSLSRWFAKAEPEPKLLSRWPNGSETWVESIARRLDLESTLRPRGRPKKKQPEKPNAGKES